MRSKITVEEKIVLLLALVPYLQKHGATKVTDLADRFSVSPHDIRSLATILSMAGIPGDTLAYQHQDLFDINWDLFESEDKLELVQAIGVDDTPKFSSSEAAALIAGLNTLKVYLPEEKQNSIKTLQKKLTSVATSVNLNITTDDDEQPPELIQVLFKAAQQKNKLQFEYQVAGDAKLTRVVDPLQIYQIGKSWYLQAFCHLRNSERVFRIENISNLSSIEASPVISSTSTNSDSLPKRTTIQPQQLEVLFSMNPEHLHLIEDWEPVEIKTISSSETLFSVHLFSDVKVIQLVSVIPGEIEIKSPKYLRQLVKNWAQDSLKLFR